MAAGRPNRVRELLAKSGLANENQLKAAAAHQEQWGGRFVAALVELGFVKEAVATQALAAGLRMPVTHVSLEAADKGALAKLEASFCDRNCVYPIALKDRVLTLAIADPTEIGVIDEAQAKAGVRVVAVLAPESEIVAAISRHYHDNLSMPSERLPTEGLTLDDDDDVPLELEEPTDGGAASSPSSPGANTLLDEMLEEPRHGLTAADEARIKVAMETQATTANVLRAIRELLQAKGIVVPERG